MKKPLSAHIITISLTILAAAMLTAQPAAARQLSAREAMARAAAAIPGDAAPDGLPRRVAAAAESPALTRCVTAPDGTALLYIINAPAANGFIIAAADDTFPYPLLAYAAEGSFSSDDAPQGALHFIKGCAQAVQCAISAGAPLTAAAVPESRTTPVPNFITATWDQSYPFNAAAPLSDGSRCYTGCVATAMAQVMQHFRHPSQGTGTHSYTWNGQTLTADFSATAYPWEEMPDRYSYTWTDDNIDAVATLMYHCGVSVDMMYGRSASAANIFNVPGALATYFGYDDGMTLHMRRSYGSDDWCAIIYDELAAGRPVLYSGSDTSAGGHYFICSGCDGNDCFFINWGWSGSCNGYYRLDALNAAGYAFNSDQCILTGIKPDDGIAAPDRFRIIGLGNLALYYKEYGVTYTRGNKTEYIWPTGSSTLCGFYNYDWAPVTPGMGVIFEDTSTGAQTAAEAYGYTPSQWGVAEGVKYFQIHHSAFPQSGSFRMYPAARDDNGTWHKIAMEAASPKYILVDCTPTTLTYSIDTEGLPELKADFTNPEKLPTSHLSLEVPVENVGSGEYNGTLTLRTRLAGNSYWMQQQQQLALQPGQTATVTFTLAASTAQGSYTGYVTDDAGNKVVNDFEFTVYDPNAMELQFAAMPVLTLGYEALPEGETPVDGYVALRLEAPVVCTSGLYSGTPYIMVWDMSDGTGSYVTDFDAEGSYTLAAGQTATFTFSGSLPQRSGTYLIDIYYDGQTYVEEPADYAAALEFTLSDPISTSLQMVSTDAAAPDADGHSPLYDLQGRPVNPRNPAPGLYISPGRRSILLK